jgi:hypothetical protein
MDGLSWKTSMCHIEVLVHTWLGRTQFFFKSFAFIVANLSSAASWGEVQGQQDKETTRVSEASLHQERLSVSFQISFYCSSQCDHAFDEYLTA